MNKLMKKSMITSLFFGVFLFGLLFALPNTAYANETFTGYCGHDVNTYDYAGDDRYGTNVAAVRAAYPSGADTVVIASGENFPDALCGSTLAGVADAPVVLVGREHIGSQTVQLMKDLSPKTVVVLGGTGAVGQGVVNSIKAAVPSIGKIDRLAGGDRFETNYKIWQYMKETYNADFSNQVIIATGTNFPDALAVSTYAAARKVPIILTSNPNTIPEATRSLVKSFLGTAILCGGSAVVSDSTASWLTEHGATVKRLAGESRYGTSKAIAEYGSTHGMDCSALIVADGRNFPDALSSSCFGNGFLAPIVLSDAAQNSVMTDYVSNNKNYIDKVLYIGGAGAVPTDLKTTIRNILDNTTYTVTWSGFSWWNVGNKGQDVRNADTGASVSYNGTTPSSDFGTIVENAQIVQTYHRGEKLKEPNFSFTISNVNKTLTNADGITQTMPDIVTPNIPAKQAGSTEFVGWNIDTSQTVTKNMTITATFKEIKSQAVNHDQSDIQNIKPYPDAYALNSYLSYTPTNQLYCGDYFWTSLRGAITPDSYMGYDHSAKEQNRFWRVFATDSGLNNGDKFVYYANVYWLDK